MAKDVHEFRVSPTMQPFMEKHGDQAAAAINNFLANAGCETDDDRLGALGVLAVVLTRVGETIRKRSQN